MEMVVVVVVTVGYKLSVYHWMNEWSSYPEVIVSKELEIDRGMNMEWGGMHSQTKRDTHINYRKSHKHIVHIGMWVYTDIFCMYKEKGFSFKHIGAKTFFYSRFIFLSMIF